MNQKVTFRPATPADLSACMDIRDQTPDNPIPREVLESIGVTEESWGVKMREGVYRGIVVECDETLVGYCFAEMETGEIMVLALLKGYEGRGLGKALLLQGMELLRASGHQKLWLAAAPDPAMRAYHFYRHLGWKSTGTYDANGDEILTYQWDKF